MYAYVHFGMNQRYTLIVVSTKWHICNDLGPRILRKLSLMSFLSCFKTLIRSAGKSQFKKRYRKDHTFVWWSCHGKVAKLFRKIKRYVADDIEAAKKVIAISITSLLYDLGRDEELNVLHYGSVFATNWAKGKKMASASSLEQFLQARTVCPLVIQICRLMSKRK